MRYCKVEFHSPKYNTKTPVLCGLFCCLLCQFPDSSPALPAELAELSFDDEDYDDNDDDDENESDGEGEDEEERVESHQSETSDDNEEGDVQNEEEDVTTATEDEEAGEDAAAVNGDRMLDLEGWFLHVDDIMLSFS